jgi:hypothetical protein
MKTVLDPPRKLINNLISRTRKLIKGQTVFVEVPEYGVILSADLSWQDDDDAYLDSWEISSPMNDTTDREKKLISLIEDCYDVNSVFEKCIFKSKQFKDFKLEIKQLCTEIDGIEKQFDGFNWEENILIPAETIKTRLRQ